VPPGYEEHSSRRYPVVYSLHGYSFGAEQWTHLPFDPNDKVVEDIKTPAESSSLPFHLRARLAVAAAWSPNPDHPPLFVDLPTKNGGRDQELPL